MIKATAGPLNSTSHLQRLFHAIHSNSLEAALALNLQYCLQKTTQPTAESRVGLMSCRSDFSEGQAETTRVIRYRFHGTAYSFTAETYDSRIFQPSRPRSIRRGI